MEDSGAASWWYDFGGQQASPETLAGMQQHLAVGRVTAQTRVWRVGMNGWLQLAQVPELATLLPPPAVAPPAFPPPAFPPLPAGPPAPPAGYGAPQPAFGQPAASPTGASPAVMFEEMSFGMIVLLSIVTLGIYGLVKFFQMGKGYEALAGRESKFALYFWLYIGLSFAGAVFPLFYIAAIVFQFLTLSEALTCRDEGLRRWGLNAPVMEASKHKLYLGLGYGLTIILVGLVFFILQAIKWFEDWNTVGRVARARGR